MTTEVLSLERTAPVRREDFGSGRAGEWAYQTILAGASCETYIDAYGNRCGELSVGTVDVDILGNLDLFPYCSDTHAQLLEDQLVSEIEKNGDHTAPGRNGFGRG